MRRIILSLALVVCSLFASSQEVLVPLCLPSHSSSSKSGQVLTLPFFDDFSNYSGLPDSARWQPSGAFVNSDFAPFAPTLGMATFDAVNSQGELYHNNTEAFSADTLCSLPLRLDSLFQPLVKALHPSDSVALSFYYSPAGIGNVAWAQVGSAPGPSDSLILEFFNPTASRWEIVWATGGFDTDSLVRTTGTPWQWVFIPLQSNDYFKAGFQFRFRNLCSLDYSTTLGLVANSDQWNIDYVRLDYQRSIFDSTSRDVAFIERSPSFLKRYTAMPAVQFRTSDMADSVVLRIANLYQQQLSTSYHYSVFDGSGTLINDNTAGHENVPAWTESHQWGRTSQFLSNTVNFSFPTGTQKGTYTIVHVVSEGISGDTHPENDTVVLLQPLQDYYAYDDGVAENGYGVTTNLGLIKIALQFSLAQADTLTAIDLYFNHTLDGYNERAPFYLCIWSSENGHPGTLLYRDTQRRYARFEGHNTYCRYILEAPQMVSGTIFVGIEQATNGYLNLGFDRSHDASRYLYYLAGSTWQQSILCGAAMIRPYFGAQAAVGIDRPTASLAPFFPNPAHDLLTIHDGVRQGVIYNSLGQPIAHIHGGQVLNVASWTRGSYLLVADGISYTLIIL